MRYPICLNSNTYKGSSLDDAVEGARRAGIHLIEISAVAGCQHIDPQISDNQLHSLRDTLATHGLEAVALGGHANLTTLEGRQLFRRNLQLGARLGVKYVVTGTGDRHGDSTSIEDEAGFSRTIRKLAEAAGDFGVTMAIETHGANYATGAQLLKLIQKVDSANLAINYDTGNTIFYGDTDPYDDLEVCLDHIVGIHLKDKAGARAEWNFPAVGEGETDFARIAGILLDSPRQGSIPLSIEVEFTPKGPSSLDQVHTAVQTSVETIQSLW